MCWECKCSCGNDTPVYVTSYDLTHNHTKSCGCLRNELAANRGHEMWAKSNEYDLCGDYGVGYDSNNMEFYFDLKDYDKIKDYCWHISRDGYVAARDVSENCIIKMHRLVMGFPNGDVDHINHKLYDNRECNLRVCAHAENMMNQSKRSDNTSGVVGVNFHKSTKKWQARIGVYGQRIELGLFDTFEDAVIARKNAEEQFYKEFSYDNSTRGEQQ